MKYSIDIFSIIEEDKNPEILSRELLENPLYKKFTDFILEATEKMYKQLEGIEYNKNKLIIFDEFYKTIHIIKGFAEILKLKKILHLATILEVILDFIREIKTTSKHSIDYLIKIIIKEIGIITQSLIQDKKSEQDVSSLIEECRTYLHKPISEWIASLPENNDVIVQDDVVYETNKEEEFTKKIEITQEEPEDKKTEIRVLLTNEIVDDEPEDLEIPPSKVGLISDFYEEASENLNQIASQVLELENAPDSQDILHQLFRNFHTLKGGARLLNIQKMEKLCHAIENLLDLCRSNELKISGNIIDIILDGHKILLEMIEEVASKGPIYSRIQPIINKITLVQGKKESVEQEELNQKESKKQVEQGEPVRNIPEKKEVLSSTANKQEANSPSSVKKSFSRQMNVIRVSTEKLDTVMNISSELPIARIRFRDQISTLGKLYRDLKKIAERAIENEPEKFIYRLKNSNDLLLEELNQLFQMKASERDKVETCIKKFYHELASEVYRTELTVTEEMMLLQIAFNELKQNIEKNVENLETITTKLQNSVMNFRMVPISSLLEKFPTQTREIARQNGKMVIMKIKGGETELDKVMITRLVDPILHILRNSIDHGIETPEEREKCNKPLTGNIELNAFYQGSNVIIQIKDDGKGIDKEKIKQKVIEKDLVSKEKLESMNETELFDLLFLPGFSTASKITEISGRGVGMDVVKSTINEIQGNIELSSKKGEGTTISLKIPLTLAAVRVLLLDIGSQQIALPMSNIDEVITISRGELKEVGKQVIYHLRDHVLPVVHLASILDINHSFYLPDSIPLVILGEGNHRLGIIVDKLLGRHEIVIKNLGSLLHKAPFIMGCTILSDNKLVLILNTREILEVAKEKLNITDIKLSKNNEKKEHKILVVDDSAIYRQNMNSILSRSGYIVEEAENGYEALQQVTLKNYSLLCVDIVMPLMDGFELTKRLRNLPLYKNVPIILITSRTSQEDKNIAFKLGANEYFEKPIEPDVLLECIHKYLRNGEGDES
ncbi:MAG: hybrid sensor histidine kinase/response regulator [Leptospiraceae bacterium]|nr:hybrid sensor histidine kinase/response regulator [Leptospiraceae bacterium]